MTTRFTRTMLALFLPFALASCLFSPGKFVSTLTVNADRSFAFTYLGEVYAVDPSGNMKGMTEDSKPAPKDPAAEAKAKADADAKNRLVAEALSMEAGYRKVAYLGNGKFTVDYAIKGVLDHNFIYPFNIDAQAIVPFIAIELRTGGTVRMKAPAFAKTSDDASPIGGMDQAASKLDGVFTLDTDAVIVSQNNEDGVKTGAAGRKTITWKATPLSKDAPTAVLKWGK